MRKAKMEIEDQTPLTVEESRRLRRQVIQAETGFDEELKKKNDEIERLKSMLTDAESDLQDARAELERAKANESQMRRSSNVGRLNLPDSQIIALKFLANHGGTVFANELWAHLSLSAVEFDYHLEALQEKGLAKTQSEGRLALTQKGRERVIEDGLSSW